MINGCDYILIYIYILHTLVNPSRFREVRFNVLDVTTGCFLSLRYYFEVVVASVAKSRMPQI